MGYMHIENLYRIQQILEFKWLYALEKIDGTSAHISWNKGTLGFFSGGTKHANFIKLFDQDNLAKVFTELFGTDSKVIVYGEAYGGKLQGMSKTYGPDLNFIVFDVNVDDLWLDVPNAENVADKLNLEFVSYEKSLSDTESLDKERLLPSVQAIRNGQGGNHMREGVVLRPPFEVRLNNGDRLIAKYKNPEFSETKTFREATPEMKVTLDSAQAVADEWVTEMRLTHVLSKLTITGIESTGAVVVAMVEDVIRESSGEVENTRENRAAIGKKAAQMFKKRISTIG